jgi:hypothetical protein
MPSAINQQPSTINSSPGTSGEESTIMRCTSPDDLRARLAQIRGQPLPPRPSPPPPAPAAVAPVSKGASVSVPAPCALVRPLPDSTAAPAPVHVGVQPDPAPFPNPVVESEIQRPKSEIASDSPPNWGSRNDQIRGEEWTLGTALLAASRRRLRFILAGRAPHHTLAEAARLADLGSRLARRAIGSTEPVDVISSAAHDRFLADYEDSIKQIVAGRTPAPVPEPDPASPPPAQTPNANQVSTTA